MPAPLSISIRVDALADAFAEQADTVAAQLQEDYLEEYPEVACPVDSGGLDEVHRDREVELPDEV